MDIYAEADEQNANQRDPAEYPFRRGIDRALDALTWGYPSHHSLKLYTVPWSDAKQPGCRGNTCRLQRIAQFGAPEKCPPYTRHGTRFMRAMKKPLRT